MYLGAGVTLRGCRHVTSAISAPIGLGRRPICDPLKKPEAEEGGYIFRFHYSHSGGALKDEDRPPHASQELRAEA